MSAERSDRAEQMERGDRAARINTPSRTDPAKSGMDVQRSEHAERLEQADRVARQGESSQTERVGRTKSRGRHGRRRMVGHHRHGHHRHFHDFDNPRLDDTRRSEFGNRDQTVPSREVTQPDNRDIESPTTTTPENSPESKPVELSRRQSRRLMMIQRRADRMISHGFGERALGRIERQLNLVERRIERGVIDADQGNLFADTLRGIISDLRDRMPVKETTPPIADVGDPVTSAEDSVENRPVEWQPSETPFRDLPRPMRRWVRQVRSHAIDAFRSGNSGHAQSVIEKRIEWVDERIEKGLIAPKHAANLKAVFERILAHVTPAATDDATGTEPTSRIPGTVDRSITAVEAHSPHRNQMYAYAANQYRLAS